MAEKSPDDLKTEVSELKEWINTQPHLPKDIEDRLLRRFIHSCYHDVEKAKKAVDLFFSIRASAPDLLNNRDPLSPQVQKALKVMNQVRIKISGNRNLWVFRLIDPGLENYDAVNDAKLFFLTTDTWLLDDDNLEEADIALFDVKDVTLKIMTKFNMSISKKLTKYQEEAFPIRIKEIHVVNAPPFIDKIFTLMKFFMKKDTCQMLHFHVPNSETLYQYLCKDDLPEDYGGNLEKMEIQMKKVVDLMLSKRDYFLNDNLWKALNKKSKNNTEDSLEIRPFKSLSID